MLNSKLYCNSVCWNSSAEPNLNYNLNRQTYNFGTAEHTRNWVKVRVRPIMHTRCVPPSEVKSRSDPKHNLLVLIKHSFFLFIVTDIKQLVRNNCTCKFIWQYLIQCNSSLSDESLLRLLEC